MFIMHINKAIILLTIFFLPMIAIGKDFDVHVGKIHLPDILSLNKSITTKEENYYYVFSSFKEDAVFNTTLSITVFNYKKNAPLIGRQTPKTAATSCIKDTLTALNKTFKVRQATHMSDSLIGNHFAMDISIFGDIRGNKYRGFLRCMKYKDFVVSAILYEPNNIKLIDEIKGSILNMKLYKK